MLNKVAIFFAFLVLIPGCAKINSTGISYPSSEAQRLFIWKSNYSAGMGTNSGICAQGALTAFATNSKIGVKIPQGDVDADQTVAVSNINATNNQTAYANISLFYLCQIALNNIKTTTTTSGCVEDTKNQKKTGCTTVTVREPTIDNEKLVQMWNTSNNVITAITGANFPNTQTNAPEIKTNTEITNTAEQAKP